jgi:hypothetical protein
MIDDLDVEGAGKFLAAHHVPFVSPEMGTELIKIVKRLDVVSAVYPLPPTVDVYRLALHLILKVAVDHQNAFCTKLEDALRE